MTHLLFENSSLNPVCKWLRLIIQTLEKLFCDKINKKYVGT